MADANSTPPTTTTDAIAECMARNNEIVPTLKAALPLLCGIRTTAMDPDEASNLDTATGLIGLALRLAENLGAMLDKAEWLTESEPAAGQEFESGPILH